MSQAHQILFLAPNIPQVYVALEIIKSLKKYSDNCHFIISSRNKYQNLISEVSNVTQVGLYPSFKNQLIEDEFTCILFIGHSYFIKKDVLKWVSNLIIPTLWINAHFEKTDLVKWTNDEKFANKLVHTFNAIFYETINDLDALKQIGFQDSQLFLVENAKYDCAIPSKNQISSSKLILDSIRVDKKIIVAGSIKHGLETTILLENFARLRKTLPNVLLILAPRSMNEIQLFIDTLIFKKESFVITSNPMSWNTDVSILLVDQMGLLKGFYHWANIAFMGRTLVENCTNGSNIMEPASQAIPIIVGPYTNDFQTILADFINEDALLQLSNSAELSDAFIFLLTHSDRANTLGENAAALIHKNSGGLKKTARLIYKLYLS